MPFDAEGEDWDASQLANPPLEGFLLKKGAKGITLGWKRRWFVLSNQRIYYYKTSDAVLGTEQGFIDLCGAYQLEEGEELGHFRIRTPQRLWFLAAEAEEECRFWVQGLTSYKKRQHRSVANLNAIDRLRSSASSRTAASDDPSLEEQVLDLERQLEEADLVIEEKSRHVDELFTDLQNSIHIIRLKGNQVDLLLERLAQKEAECVRLAARKEVGPLTPSSVRSDPHLQGGSHRLSWNKQTEELAAKGTIAPLDLPSQVQLPPLETTSPPLGGEEERKVERTERAEKTEEIEQKEALAPEEVPFKLGESTTPLPTPQFLQELLQSMRSYHTFLEGKDETMCHVINHWSTRVAAHLEQKASLKPELEDVNKEPH